MRSSWVTMIAAVPRDFISSRISVDDLVAELRVEGGGRLVEQDEVRFVHERPADRHALALATGELGGRLPARLVSPSSSSSWSARSLALRAGAWTEFVDDEQVLARGQERNEVDGLKDEPDRRCGGTRSAAWSCSRRCRCRRR